MQVSERSNHSQSLTAYGDWSEQLSKSGKKYYYNRQTDASSWEKPREWVEAERSRQERSRDWCSDHDKLKSTPAKLHCDRNNRSSQVRPSLTGQASLTVSLFRINTEEETRTGRPQCQAQSPPGTGRGRAAESTTSPATTASLTTTTAERTHRLVVLGSRPCLTD